MNNYIFNINNGFITKNTQEIYLALLSFLKSHKEKIIFQSHPLGFKYFKLGEISKNEELRLHFWIETNEKQDDDLQIHDHSFDFESFIVYGKIKNVKYISVNDERFQGFMYNVRFQNENSKLVLGSKNQFLKIIEIEKIRTGEFYSLKSNELHKSENIKDSTISLLKIIKLQPKVARVFSPKELINFSRFERKILSKSENLKFVEVIIKKIEKQLNLLY